MSKSQYAHARAAELTLAVKYPLEEKRENVNTTQRV